MSKLTVAYDDGNIVIRFEDLGGERCIHVDVDTITPSVVRRLKEVWEDIRVVCKREGYSYVRSYTQNKKFCKLATPCFNEEGILEHNGKEYEVLRWDL